MLPAGIGSEYTQQEKSASRRADLSRTSAGRGIVRFENELGAGRASAISILSPAQRNAILTGQTGTYSEAAQVQITDKLKFDVQRYAVIEKDAGGGYEKLKTLVANKDAISRKRNQSNNSGGGGGGSTNPVVRKHTPKFAPATKLPKSLRYPYERVDNTQDYIQFSIYEYKRSGITGGPLKTDSLGSITLPVPSQVTDTNAANYGSSNLNNMGAGALNMAKNFIGGNVEGGVSAADNLIKETLGSGLSEKYFASQAISSLGVNLSMDQLLARTEGNILNPNMELLFSGPSLRQFKFSFKFTPRFDQESNEVKMIIKAFKKNMSPRTGGMYLKTPNIFGIRYLGNGGKDHQFLNKFKLCALTNMSVNYTADGVHATYSDETPVAMTMDLSFQELTPVYNEDYDYDEKKQGGVGF